MITNQFTRDLRTFCKYLKMRFCTTGIKEKKKTTAASAPRIRGLTPTRPLIFVLTAKSGSYTRQAEKRLAPGNGQDSLEGPLSHLNPPRPRASFRPYSARQLRVPLSAHPRPLPAAPQAPPQPRASGSLRGRALPALGPARRALGPARSSQPPGPRLPV